MGNISWKVWTLLFLESINQLDVLIWRHTWHFPVSLIFPTVTEIFFSDKHSSLVDIWPPPTITQLVKPPFLDTPKTVMLPQAETQYLT